MKAEPKEPKEPKVCREHGLPKVWGIKTGVTLRTYCTKCMDERWGEEFAKEREERERFAYLIPYKLWLLENYSYHGAMWRLQIARKVHRDFGRPINEVSHAELNERYGRQRRQSRNNNFGTAKKSYERFLELKGKGGKNATGEKAVYESQSR